ncbi:MAG: phospholipase A [Desulfobacteraceae bacterium]|nr:phospholipase A [Desulfobacteraceae bacterium]
MTFRYIRRLLVCLFCYIVLIGNVNADENILSEDKKTIMQLGKGLSLHKQNYIIPLTWGNNDSAIEDAEVKFQISVKQKLFNTNFYIGYSQKSFWRVLDEEDSRPFRETNYNPEFFYSVVPEKNPLGNWSCNIGYEHESNGSSLPKSRSWDRLYIAPYYEHKNFRADLKIWYRIPENDKDNENDTSGDDNPDIEDYYGYGQVKFRYEWSSNHMLSLIGRCNPKTGNAGAQIDYSWPGPGKRVFFFTQLWTGYGESLIDYNHYITSFGVGVMFKR